MQETPGLRLDLLTVAAISVVAYVLQNVLHEAVGHGGTCLILGGDPTALSTAYFDMVAESVSPLGSRLVPAGGAVVNVIAGGLFWFLLRAFRTRSASLRYFLWISMTINLLSGTGYLLFSGILQIGDWVTVIEGLKPFWLWNTLMVVAGLATYALSIWLALHTMLPLVGGKESIAGRRSLQLSLYPYLVGSVAGTAGAFLNPLSPVLIATSAAANFGGTSGLAWMTQLYRKSWFEPPGQPGIEIARSWAWIVIGTLLLMLHVFLLGPSIEL